MKFNITIEDIRALGPCYDPIKYLPENWSGTIIDILDNNVIPGKDRIWAVRTFVDLGILRRFALAAAKEASQYTKDQRVHDCIKTTELYLNGEASLEELEWKRAAAYAASASITTAANSAACAADAAGATYTPYGVDAAANAANAAAYGAAHAAYTATSAYDAEVARISCLEKLCTTLTNLIKESL